MKKLAWLKRGHTLWVSTNGRLDYAIYQVSGPNGPLGEQFSVNFQQDGGAEQHIVTIGGGKDSDRLNRAMEAAQEHLQKLYDHHVTGARIIVWGGGPDKGKPLAVSPEFKEYLEKRFG